MEINLKLATVVILCAPSNAGKSYFCNNYLVPQLQKQGVSVKLISSDSIRQELILDTTAGKHEQRMLHVSEQAFKLLYAQVDAHTSYPVNTQIVVVDTRGMSPEFRNDIKEIAKKNNYNVSVIMMDYKNRDDYYNNGEDLDKRFITKDINKFKIEVIKEIKTKDFESIYAIKNKNFDDVIINVTDKNEYDKNLLTGSASDYITIGDIHGCYDDLIRLLNKAEFEVTNNQIIIPKGNSTKIILVGDIIDKGPNIKEVIDLVYKNQEIITMVIGNHENFVYKYLKGMIKPGTLTQEFIDDYFNTTTLLKDDEVTRTKFYDIVDKSHPFLIHENFVVTHAPCNQKYIGKLSNYSLKAQRNFSYPKAKDYETKEDYNRAILGAFSFLVEDGAYNKPYHIFGHVAVEDAKLYKNKIALDSGAVYNNKLTGVIIPYRGKPFFINTSSGKERTEELINIFPKQDYVVQFSELEPRERGRIFFAAENKINFLAGTICPADKNMDTMELESLKDGLDFFKGKGQTKVMLQKKYMGSNFQILLYNKNLLNTERVNKGITRNGYLPKKLDLTPVYEQLYEKWQSYMEVSNVECMIFNAEMMPWKCMAEGLINKSFLSYQYGMKSEVDILRENGFEEALAEANNKLNTCGYLQDEPVLTDKEIKAKYGDAQAKSMKSLKFYNNINIPLDDLDKMIATFDEQIKIHGADGDIHAKPFAILKIVYQDGTEKLFLNEKNEEMYKLINDDEYCMVDLTAENYYEVANEFYQRVIGNEKMEGIVIKPEIVYTEGLPPAIKCRSPKYLHITFGSDYLFPFKYNRLIKKKHVNRKMRTSINEWNIGKKMLEIPFNQINKENKQYMNLFAQMIGEEKIEQTLDPRL